MYSMAFVNTFPANRVGYRTTAQQVTKVKPIYQQFNSSNKLKTQSRPNKVLCCVTSSSSSPSSTTVVKELREKIEELAGAERGIFGLPEEERELLDEYIKKVEGEQATVCTTADNAKAAEGKWRLIYTTLQILGRRRVRLAVSTPTKSGFVKLGEFYQAVNSSTTETSNIVHFNVFGQTSGTFTIDAEYEVINDKRVRVNTSCSSLRPESLKKLLGKNEVLLTEIFNPSGYLDITYVDKNLRIGRDDKGQTFVLEKVNVE